MYEYGALVEWYWQEKADVLGEKSVPVPLFAPQIPNVLTKGRTWSSAVIGGRLIARAMAQPQVCQSLAGIVLSNSSSSRMTSLYLPQTVIVEGVVTGVGQMNTKSCTHRIEYLDSCIHPHLQNRSMSLNITWRTPLEESSEQNGISVVLLIRLLSLWPCQNSHWNTRVTATVALQFTVSWRH